MSTPTQILLVLCFTISCYSIHAQPHLGLRADIGNPLTYSPTSRGFETPPAISGSLLLNYHEKHDGGWTVQYEAHLGVLGYNMKVISLDTLADPEAYPFPEYSTFYGGVSVVVFRDIRIADNELMIGLGGGGSYYHSFFPVTTYSITIIDSNSEYQVFNAEINSPTNKIVPFATIAGQYPLSHLFSIRMEYSHYFKDVLAGSFEFHHTRTPVRGEMSLRPKVVSVGVLFSLGRRSVIGNQ